MSGRLFLALSIGLFACGGGGGDDDGNVDAPTGMDTAQATVMTVDPCPATVAGTIMTNDATFSYSPNMLTISQGQVVKFMTTATHDVAPNTTMSDPGLKVGFNKTACLMFTQTGTFKFHCTPHGFGGTVTVQ